MNRIVAGPRRPPKMRSDTQPHRIVPGIAAYSNMNHAALDSWNEKPFAVSR